eukprot:TRINITY_DN54315_c0_g1_i1.p1 TRINITY_DN54315_c0_g1~~TRINITY_DN54315_c0_g1_i1.p1  ORF type:complete len:487 (+),score=94.43 TRINITY_DN54315_c0_g1_i1:217-1461(+)
MAGYSLVASVDEGSRQEYAIKALKFVDLVAELRGPSKSVWCEPWALAAFATRWPMADSSVQLTSHWANCGATAGPVTWTGLLKSICSMSHQLPRDALPGFRRFSPLHPRPLVSWRLCVPGYAVLAPNAFGSDLVEFYKELSPRASMAASPFWSRPVQRSCVPAPGCTTQSTFLLLEALRHADHSSPGGLYLEFGVASGGSANRTARYLQASAAANCELARRATLNAANGAIGGVALDANLRTIMAGNLSGANCRRHAPLVYGFDSFLGLPEDWDEHPRGTFGRGGVPPPMESNVVPVVGWFNETLPQLVDKLRDRRRDAESARQLRVAFAYIDCDTYTSALEALLGLQHADLLGPGAIIAFDELLDHPGSFSRGELGALREFLARYPRPFEVVLGSWRRAATEHGGFVAIRLLA